MSALALTPFLIICATAGACCATAAAARLSARRRAAPPRRGFRPVLIQGGKTGAPAPARDAAP